MALIGYLTMKPTYIPDFVSAFPKQWDRMGLTAGASRTMPPGHRIALTILRTPLRKQYY